MRIYFYIGPNKELKSGFSIKLWKIVRKGRKVTVKWGPAMVDLKKRKVLKASWTQGRDWTFASESEAKAQSETENRRTACPGIPPSAEKKIVGAVRCARLKLEQRGLNA